MKKVVAFIIVLLVMVMPIVGINAGVTDGGSKNVERITTTNYHTKVSFKGTLTDKNGNQESFNKESSEISGNYSDKAVTNEVNKLKNEFITWAKDKGAIIFTAGKSEVSNYYYDVHDEIAAKTCDDSECDGGGVTINTVMDKHQTYDVNYTAKVDDLKFTKGANGKFTLDSKNNLSFTLNADYSFFKTGGKVYINNELLNSKNYTSKSGSIVVTLKNAYLNTLTEGSYTIKVELNNGLTAQTKFTVTKSSKVEPEPEPEPVIVEPTKESTNESVKEVKSNNIWLYVGIGIAVLVVAGVVIYIFNNKKKK